MLSLRPIRWPDNPVVKDLVQTVMAEFACIGEGFSSSDPELEDMFGAYAGPRSAFYVLTDPSDRIVGVGGYAPLAAGDEHTCELRKMYLLPTVRGLGGGKRLLQHCIQAARADGYTRMYLETVQGMTSAAELYRRNGFTPLDKPLGHTGHSGCDRYMLRELT